MGMPDHSHFVLNLVDGDLVRPAKAVLNDLTTREVQVQGADGRDYLMKVRPYRTTANVSDGVVVIFTDITDHTTAEKLRRLAAIVQDSNDAIMVVGEDGRIRAWNPGAERMYGYSEQEALAMNMKDLAPPSRHREVLDMVKRVLKEGALAPVEVDRVAKGGKRLRVWLTATALVGGDGRAYQVATTERDIAGQNSQ